MKKSFLVVLVFIVIAFLSLNSVGNSQTTENPGFKLSDVYGLRNLSTNYNCHNALVSELMVSI